MSVPLRRDYKLRTACVFPPDESSLSEEQLLAKYQVRIRNLARRMAPHAVPTVNEDDLMQVGAIALIRVARRFDPSRGVPFGAYLQPRLRGAMLDLLETDHARYFCAPRDGQWDTNLRRRVGPSVHPDTDNDQYYDPQFFGNMIEFIENIQDRTRKSPEDDAAMSGIAELLAHAADIALDDRERIILRALFEDGLTLEETGRLVGIGESRVCQIRVEILAKLKARLRTFGVTSIPDAL